MENTMNEKWTNTRGSGVHSRGEYEIRRVEHLTDSGQEYILWEVYHKAPGKDLDFIGDAYRLSDAKLIAEKDERARAVIRRKNPSTKPNALPIIKETHMIGQVLIENLEHLKNVDLTRCDFGIQTHNDGRVWVCLNGIAFLRFKPIITDKDLVETFTVK